MKTINRVYYGDNVVEDENGNKFQVFLDEQGKEVLVPLDETDDDESMEELNG